MLLLDLLLLVDLLVDLLRVRFAGKFAGAGGCAGGFAGAGFGIENAAATGSAFLSCMPHGLVTQFTDELLVDMCAHMAVNHGVLALGGTASPQGCKR